MEYMTPNFTKDMVKTHKILIPNMAVTQFRLMQAALASEGYQTEVLGNCGSEVAQLGLKYVHNDTCYPALLVIGQFLDALNSGKYDLDHTALMITQTGGGCRASNYIHLLRKALRKSGFGNVPVMSLNFSGLEKDSSLKFTVPMVRKAIAACLYGDELMALANQIRPNETHKGGADKLVAYWQSELCEQFAKKRGVNKRDMRKNFAAIAASFAAIPVEHTPRVKVGVVGEIYVKYSPLGNNHLEDFLASEGCEVCLPGLLGFVQYCVANGSETIALYGGSRLVKKVYEWVLSFIAVRERMMHDAVAQFENLHAPAMFSDTMALADGVIGLGAKMGEGWLLTTEMMELVQSGFASIVCAQPFGCLPNHVVGKGMISKIRAIHPEANITPIDYDPSATAVNQENRIKLMIAVAKERLGAAEGNVEHAEHGNAAVPFTALPRAEMKISNL